MNHHCFLRHGLFLGCVLLALTATAQTPSPLNAATESEITEATESATSAWEDEQGAVQATSTEDTENTVEGQIAVDDWDFEQQPLEGDGDPLADPEEEVLSAPLPHAHDLSPWGMYQMADWVVKSVMIGLLLASLATWTVLVAKTRELRGLVRGQKQALSIVAEARGLEEASNRLEESKSVADLAQAAAEELQLSASALADAEGVKERVASRLERIEAARGRKVTKGTSILATIGSTAPFVGLFGTVWGIMNSFIGIAEAQTTNLAVVAPGIAEALLATALGLVAAIPAVVIYNHFARQIVAYKALVGDTSAAILRLVSRDLSRLSVTGQNVFSKE